MIRKPVSLLLCLLFLCTSCSSPSEPGANNDVLPINLTAVAGFDGAVINSGYSVSSAVRWIPRFQNTPVLRVDIVAELDSEDESATVLLTFVSQVDVEQDDNIAGGYVVLPGTYVSEKFGDPPVDFGDTRFEFVATSGSGASRVQTRYESELRRVTMNVTQRSNDLIKGSVSIVGKLLTATRITGSRTEELPKDTNMTLSGNVQLKIGTIQYSPD